jgi:hypothetical protein
MAYLVVWMAVTNTAKSVLARPVPAGMYCTAEAGVGE